VEVEVEVENRKDCVSELEEKLLRLRESTGEIIVGLEG
jgi:hypothetical protein